MKQSSIINLLLSLFSTKAFFSTISPKFNSKEEAYRYAKKIRILNYNYTSRLQILSIAIISSLYISDFINFYWFIGLFTFFDLVVIRTLNNRDDFAKYETNKKPIQWIEKSVTGNNS